MQSLSDNFLLLGNRNSVSFPNGILDETQKSDDLGWMILALGWFHHPSSLSQGLQMDLSVHEAFQEVITHNEKVVNHQGMTDAEGGKVLPMRFQDAGEQVYSIPFS